jgi:hypothetical protein
MDLQWRNFPLALTLAAAVVTPAFGQAVAPTLGPANSVSESAESIPDFSGFWVHPLPGFEPLASGPELCGILGDEAIRRRWLPAL